MDSVIPLASASGWWDLVERGAALAAHETLLSDTQGRSLTYEEYRDCSERVAAGLWLRGVRPGTTVSWQLPTTLEAAVLMSALARLGATQNPLLPVLREAEIEPIFAQLRPDFFVTPTMFRDYDHAALGRRLTGEHCELVTCQLANRRTGLGLPQADPGVIARVPAPGAADLAPRWVFFTSSSTGAPRGVLHTDASLIASSEASIVHLKVNPDDVLCMPHPIANVGGAGQLATSLRSGASTVLVDVFDARRTPYDFAAAHVTVLGSAAPFFHAYLTAQREFGPERLFPRLRLSINGGALAPAELFERVPRELGGRGLFNGYGMTEFPRTGYAQFNTDRGTHHGAGACLPAPGVSVRAVGPDGRDVAPGAEGELRLRGPQLFAGYLGASPRDTVIDEQGFFPTGDLGVVEADGSYRVTARPAKIIERTPAHQQR